MKKPIIILSRTQMAENIGAAARVMANFGLETLRLVAPRDGWINTQAWPMAAGGDYILEKAELYHDLPSAMHDVTEAWAVTARKRELNLPVCSAREAAEGAASSFSSEGNLALIFGNERNGLDNHEVSLCQKIVTVPVNPKYPSLNIAQAVAVLAYEMFVSCNNRDTEAPESLEENIATQHEVALMVEQLHEALLEKSHYHEPNKIAKMKNNLHAMFAKAHLSQQEVRTLRGIINTLSSKQ